MTAAATTASTATATPDAALVVAAWWDSSACTAVSLSVWAGHDRRRAHPALARQRLRRPVGPIHWAGAETADEWTGFLDGAVRSGQRAAADVAARLPATR
ncbi:FAD-dependent oxidoreductase [Candidatus Mycobacterium methanotrophicum]|uniref:FAD-dependent oxidoreductase n=1 Tax=Candidatus Mycobacterium methanotrophicum TaxID=2943498 RepID=A0ABY4QP85_9MYCO|nr:FAD-dependent oxidoreductase [Candidatus Mycobacterium methanotrophicum]UQX11676.1 FAD-dependent oxidoreductase [Candidatus Mycobacterium methanotrophicum]